MRFALALATIAVVASAATPPKVAVNFGTSLNSKAAWNFFKEKTVDHGNQSNALMKLRNTATKNSVDAETALTGANAAKASAEGLWKKATAAATAAATKNAALVASARTAQAASKATNDTAVAKTGTANIAAAKAAKKAAKAAKKAGLASVAANSAWSSADSASKSAATAALNATTAATKSRAAAVAAHQNYANFVEKGHANGFVH